MMIVIGALVVADMLLGFVILGHLAELQGHLREIEESIEELPGEGEIER